MAAQEKHYPAILDEDFDLTEVDLLNKLHP
jgi:hypothetical protein